MADASCSWDSIYLPFYKSKKVSASDTCSIVKNPPLFYVIEVQWVKPKYKKFLQKIEGFDWYNYQWIQRRQLIVIQKHDLSVSLSCAYFAQKYTHLVPKAVNRKLLLTPHSTNSLFTFFVARYEVWFVVAIADIIIIWIESKMGKQDYVWGTNKLWYER